MNRSKYNQKKVHKPYGDFDSKKEHMRWLELKAMEAQGKISGLQAHAMKITVLDPIKKKVLVNLKTKQKMVERVDEMAVRYTPDFTYVQDGVTILEEVKSSGTRLARDYSLRRKLVKHWIIKENERLGHEHYRFLEYGN